MQKIEFKMVDSGKIVSIEYNKMRKSESKPKSDIVELFDGMGPVDFPSYVRFEYIGIPEYKEDFKLLNRSKVTLAGEEYNKLKSTQIRLGKVTYKENARGKKHLVVVIPYN